MCLEDGVWPRTKRSKRTYPTFKIGDWVIWDSQAGGFWTRKKGWVVEVVPPRRRPFGPVRDPGFDGRPYESYVVEVPGATAWSKPRYYWPNLNRIRKAKKPSIRKVR